MKIRILFRGEDTLSVQQSIERVEGAADRLIIIGGDERQPSDTSTEEWVRVVEEELTAASKRGEQVNIEVVAAGPPGLVAQTVARLVHWATAVDLTPNNHLELHHQPGPPRPWRYVVLEALKDGTRELFGD